MRKEKAPKQEYQLSAHHYSSSLTKIEEGALQAPASLRFPQTLETILFLGIAICMGFSISLN